MKVLLKTAIASACALAATTATAAEPVKIAHILGQVGPYAPYAKQLIDGMAMGFEYATDGSNTVQGRALEVSLKDTTFKPDVARALVAEAYGDEEADMVVGPLSSGIVKAVLPLAEEYEKIIIPEGAAASITGADRNRYTFRIGRNTDQDAIAAAIATGGKDTYVAYIAQDYNFGHDSVKAATAELEKTGAKVVHTDFLPKETTEFTAAIQRSFDALKDKKGRKFVSPVWAGANNPTTKIKDANPERYGIKIAVGGNILPAMKAYKALPGAEGATYYYYEIPDNEVNNWLVKEHFKRFDAPPDFFTAHGMSQGMGIVAALNKSGGSTDTEDLIKAFSGLKFQTPKGEMYIRPEDGQAMQDMYHFRIRVEKDVEWGIPDLVRVIKKEEMKVPVNYTGK